MGADAEVKGKTNLVGTTLLVLEQALATGTTIETVVRKWCARCESVPSKIIVGALHAAEDGIRKMMNLGDASNGDPIAKIPVSVVAMVLHGSMNDIGYLTGPGCGDVGALYVGVPDK
jgi:uracil phosphoribosyltransferase